MSDGRHHNDYRMKRLSLVEMRLAREVNPESRHEPLLPNFQFLWPGMERQDSKFSEKQALKRFIGIVVCALGLLPSCAAVSRAGALLRRGSRRSSLASG